MTNPSAMVLVLLVFSALFCGAMVVILGGGRIFRRRSSRPMHPTHQHRRAA